MPKPCKHCGLEGHSSLMCFQRPRTKINSKRKILNRVGKVTAKWIETRHEWIQKHATKDGTWKCYICGRTLTLDLLTLDHIKARSSHPELRFVEDNLAPCCANCNMAKGSKSLEAFKAERETAFYRKGLRES